MTVFLNFCIAFYLCTNLFYGVLLVFGVISVRRQMRSRPLIDTFRDRLPLSAPPISVIAPAYNEEATILHSVKSFLLLEYPNHEVIVVNDGSKDRTLERLIEGFRLEPDLVPRDGGLKSALVRGVYRSAIHPNLVVIDKENGGKADALNCGIDFAEHDLFCAVDSDSLIERDALVRIAVPFIEDPIRTVASGGTIRIANGSKIHFGRVEQAELPQDFIGLIQIIEYTRAFLCGRTGWNALNATLVISGAFGLFRKDAVSAVGGYLEGSVGEDMELIVRLHRYFRERRVDYSIVFIPDPVCWTEAPSDLATLRKQRNRWQRGLADVLSRNWDMLFRKRYGTLGWLALPYFLLVELCGPVVELLAWAAVIWLAVMHQLDLELAQLFLFAGVLYSLIMTTAAIAVEEIWFSKYPRPTQFLKLLLVASIESFGYRQLTNFWRLQGLADFARGRRHWGSMKRAGF